MLNLIIGIVIGAVFAPFWVKAYNYAKEKAQAFFKKGK